MDTSELDALVGLDVETARARAGALSWSTTVRVLRPRDIMTMDLCRTRVNLYLDDDDVVREVSAS